MVVSSFSVSLRLSILIQCIISHGGGGGAEWGNSIEHFWDERGLFKAKAMNGWTFDDEPPTPIFPCY
jgi:hypothetical protein